MILQNKNNSYFSERQIAIIKGLCKSHDIDIKDVKIVKNSALKWRKAVACFSVLHPDTVYVCDDQSNLVRLLPHIAHELKHRRQLKRLGKLRYLILANPLWRKWTIEPGAYAFEEQIRLDISQKAI